MYSLYIQCTVYIYSVQFIFTVYIFIYSVQFIYKLYSLYIQCTIYIVNGAVYTFNVQFIIIKYIFHTYYTSVYIDIIRCYSIYNTCSFTDDIRWSSFKWKWHLKLYPVTPYLKKIYLNKINWKLCIIYIPIFIPFWEN